MLQLSGHYSKCRLSGNVPAEFLSQRGNSVSERTPATVFFPTQSFIAGSILSSATGVEKMVCKGNCGYDFEAPKATVPGALASANNASVRGFYKLALRAIDAYSAGMQYGAKEFKKTIHCKVEAKSNW